MVCTIFALPKWIERQQELEDIRLQNEAMALKTKKFVQFLSTDKEDRAEDVEEKKETENVDSVAEDESETCDTEEKKDK